MDGFVIANLITGYVDDEDAKILMALHRKYKMVAGALLKEVGDIKWHSALFQVAPDRLLRVVYKKTIVWHNGQPYPKYEIISPSKEVLKKYL